MTRQFTATQAKRERVPMLVGLVGPSGSGKTFSMLRLLTGMQRATGGKIFVIDTEARRALHYADEFDFQHVDMKPPFSSLDYVAAIKYCVAQGATHIGIDSLSHEHEGEGGLLEYHEAEMQRMAGDNYQKRERVKLGAWIKPKQERQKLINVVLQLGINGVFCFRAKEKIKPVSGGQPLSLGWQPIAGGAFVYEMLVNCLLYPGANGVPNWAPDERGERVMLKKPERLASVFKDGEALSEATGEALAKWAAGDDAKGEERAPEETSGNLDLAIRDMQAAETLVELDVARKHWGRETWSDDDKATIRATVEAKRAAIEQ